MPLEVEETEGEEVCTITLTGEVDASNAAELRETLRRVARAQHVIVDLRAVPFLDSAGLGALICGIRVIRFEGGEVTLCVRGAVKRLLTVTGFDRIVPMAASLAEARAGFVASGPRRIAGSARQ